MVKTKICSALEEMEEEWLMECAREEPRRNSDQWCAER